MDTLGCATVAATVSTDVGQGVSVATSLEQQLRKVEEITIHNRKSGLCKYQVPSSGKR